MQQEKSCHSIFKIISIKNESVENLRQTVEYVKSFKNLKAVELLSFHNMAGSKYTSLGMQYEAGKLALLPEYRMQELRDMVRAWLSLKDERRIT